MPEKAGHAPSKKRRMLFSSFRFRAGTHPCPQGSFFYCAAPPPYDGFPATQACGFMTHTDIIHDFLPFETPDFCPIRAHFFPFCSIFLLLLYAIWPAFSLDRKGESVYNRYDRLKSLPAFRRSRQAVFGYRLLPSGVFYAGVCRFTIESAGGSRALCVFALYLLACAQHAVSGIQQGREEKTVCFFARFFRNENGTPRRKRFIKK